MSIYPVDLQVPPNNIDARDNFYGYHGPYANSFSQSFLFMYFTPDEVTFTGVVSAFKSTDFGVTWIPTDTANQPGTALNYGIIQHPAISSYASMVWLNTSGTDFMYVKDFNLEAGTWVSGTYGGTFSYSGGTDNIPPAILGIISRPINKDIVVITNNFNSNNDRRSQFVTTTLTGTASGVWQTPIDAYPGATLGDTVAPQSPTQAYILGVTDGGYCYTVLRQNSSNLISTILSPTNTVSNALFDTVSYVLSTNTWTYNNWFSCFGAGTRMFFGGYVEAPGKNPNLVVGFAKEGTQIVGTSESWNLGSFVNLITPAFSLHTGSLFAWCQSAAFGFPDGSFASLDPTAGSPSYGAFADMTTDFPGIIQTLEAHDIYSGTIGLWGAIAGGDLAYWQSPPPPPAGPKGIVYFINLTY